MFPHFGAIIIAPETEIGDNCTIFQSVTIGPTRGTGFLKIGNNVVIFSGAKLVSGGVIGNDVIIGANAVVTKDAPSGSVIAGIPAKVISQKGSGISLLYRRG